MAKTWVLDTETKGTGAHMVPLEEVTRPRAPEKDLAVVEFRRPPREPEAPAPPAPRQFKVVDVMTREVLAEGATLPETLDVLRGFHSVVDVVVHVWEPQRSRWRLLTLDELRALWRHRDDGAGGD